MSKGRAPQKKRNRSSASINPTASPKSKKGGASVNNEVRLDPGDPIPFEKKNYFQHTDSNWDEKYIPFVNEKDNFGTLLLESSLKSNTASLCYGSIVDYVVGEGIQYDGKDDFFTNYIDECNAHGDSLDDIRKGIHFDLKTFGNAFVLMVRSSIGKDKHLYLYNLDFLECRLKYNDGKMPTELYHSLTFTQAYDSWDFNEKKSTSYPIYSSKNNEKENWKEIDGKEYSVFHLKNKMPGYKYYGMPSSIGSIMYQILEYKGARYNLDDFDNNLVIGGTIVLEGNVSQEEATQIAKRIISQHVGDGKRGRWNVIANENGIANSQVIPYDRSKDGDFLDADIRWEKKIVAANQWDLALCSLQESGGISNNNGTYLRQIYGAKNKTVILPLQKFERRRFIKPLINEINQWYNSKLDIDDVAIKPLVPFEVSSELEMDDLITVNEGREMIGMEELADGDRLISHNKKTERDVQA